MMNFFSVIFAAIVTVTGASEVPTLKVEFSGRGNIWEDSLEAQTPRGTGSIKRDDRVDITISIRTTRSKFENDDAYDLQIEGQTIAYDKKNYGVSPMFECVRWDEDSDWELSICPPDGGTLPFASVTISKKYDSEDSWHDMIPGNLLPGSRTGCVNFEIEKKGRVDELIETTSGPAPESRNLTPYCWLTSEASEVPTLQVEFHSDGQNSGDRVDITITIRTTRSKFENDDAYDLTFAYDSTTGNGVSPMFECVRWDEDSDWELSICPPNGGTLPSGKVTFLKTYDSEHSWHGYLGLKRTGCVNFAKPDKGNELIETTSRPAPESRNPTPYCWLIPDQDSATKNEIDQASQTQQEKIAIIGDYLRGKNK